MKVIKEYYQSFFSFLESTPLKHWLETLPALCEQEFDETKNGHLPNWQKALEKLPAATPSSVDYGSATVRFGEKADLAPGMQTSLRETLQSFHPWRKGPFDFFDIHIDTEWRSNLKWDRLKNAIAPLKDRLVLDIGSGNGYYGWRMLGEGAKLVVGTDPFLLYVFQNFVARTYARNSDRCYILPLGIDSLPKPLPMFDTVFSMGVLYHRRSPIDHLFDVASFIRPGGELVLETLVTEGSEDHVLTPKGRYAKMRNVWFIPSPLAMEKWLRRAGYQNIRMASISKTHTEEQRSTEWMRFESLSDFLDPDDSLKTIEGHPAPQRAIFIASL